MTTCQAEIGNLSLDGAMIKDADQVPTEGTEVSLRFRFREKGIYLLARVSSKVIHSESEGKTEKWSYGVKFEASLEKLWNELLPVIRILQEETASENPDLHLPRV